MYLILIYTTATARAQSEARKKEDYGKVLVWAAEKYRLT